MRLDGFQRDEFDGLADAMGRGHAARLLASDLAVGLPPVEDALGHEHPGVAPGQVRTAAPCARGGIFRALGSRADAKVDLRQVKAPRARYFLVDRFAVAGHDFDPRVAADGGEDGLLEGLCGARRGYRDHGRHDAPRDRNPAQKRTNRNILRQLLHKLPFTIKL
jgi:hypothetical protein